MAGIYKLRNRDAVVLPFWVDGAGMIEYLNNELHIIGGWNPGVGAPSIKPLHYKSTDDGVSFSSVSVMPQGGRTEFAISKKNDKIYVAGGNDSDETSASDVWSWNSVSGWVQVTANWGVHDGYAAFGHCDHNGYTYVMQGLIRPSTYVNEVWRSLNMVNWENMEATIPAAMQNLLYGCPVSFKGALYFFGGGRLNFPSATPYYISTKVFKSTDNGMTWTEIADDQLLNAAIWMNSCVAGGDTVLAISGSDTNNSLTANNRMIFSHDMITWRHLSKNIFGRHATCICSHGDDAFVAEGFGYNDCYKLKRVS